MNILKKNSNLQDEVIDTDIGNNSLSTFRADYLEIKITPEDALGVGDKTRDPFIVYPNGTVKTNIYFQSNMFGYFTMRVFAQNINSDLVDDAVLRVSCMLYYSYYMLLVDLPSN